MSGKIIERVRRRQSEALGRAVARAIVCVPFAPPAWAGRLIASAAALGIAGGVFAGWWLK